MTEARKTIAEEDVPMLARVLAEADCTRSTEALMIALETAYTLGRTRGAIDMHAMTVSIFNEARLSSSESEVQK